MIVWSAFIFDVIHVMFLRVNQNHSQLRFFFFLKNHTIATFAEFLAYTCDFTLDLRSLSNHNYVFYRIFSHKVHVGYAMYERFKNACWFHCDDTYTCMITDPLQLVTSLFNFIKFGHIIIIIIITIIICDFIPLGVSAFGTLPNA